MPDRETPIREEKFGRRDEETKKQKGKEIVGYVGCRGGVHPRPGQGHPHTGEHAKRGLAPFFEDECAMYKVRHAICATSLLVTKRART